MQHKWIYLRGGQYQCQACGAEALKAEPAKLIQDCPAGEPGYAEISAGIAEISARMDYLDADVALVAEKVQALENWKVDKEATL